MHTKLLIFLNLDTGAARPPHNAPVTLIGPAIPCFLMGMNALNTMRSAQVGKNCGGIANADDERLATRRQITRQFFDTFLQKTELSPRHVRLPPQFRFQNIQRHDRTIRQRRRQRGMVMQAKITFEPDNVHSCSLFVSAAE
jgi:hypothetical protein